MEFGLCFLEAVFPISEFGNMLKKERER